MHDVAQLVHLDRSTIFLNERCFHFGRGLRDGREDFCSRRWWSIRLRMDANPNPVDLAFGRRPMLNNLFWGDRG